jgi:two-component sensor histidine kinase
VRRIKISGRVVGKDDWLTLVAASQDATDIRQQGERQRILMHELNHRVKNTLAPVRSIARMTHRSRGVPDDVWLAFSHRIEGLAKTHNLLTASNWEGANFHDILASELEPNQDRLRQRIRLRGPRVSLNARGVLALGLALHELATNAREIRRAFSSLREGQRHVGRDGHPGPCTPADRMGRAGWPPALKPERQGFGSKLIQRGLAQQLGGAIKLSFEPDGVRCVISFPLHEAGSDMDRFVFDRAEHRSQASVA